MVIVCVCVSINSVAVRHTFKIIVNPSRVGKRDFRKLKVIDKKYLGGSGDSLPFYLKVEMMMEEND